MSLYVVGGKKFEFVKAKGNCMNEKVKRMSLIVGHGIIN